ncbi:hypothetical protein AN9152.2 [Aspergillus nidulans FGSC A4]|uniref:NAD-dependent epimerase/dehydratase domain-containing protein n=1 Tax=Emericella nidulans (strain FGSC A4 / ATCC 38163 / CBS 112.46 / NRRL 194 / M139) TaxID=227321 RepID=Q5ARC8_EMENI|nr:hypothetical protein [Aspergillus nidulans FGSC A4]EAA61985.1 hypothetical protein AN9152.2 [Aspergillus nidulans FGSC A4]CBF82442.1 TPA: conserved hypothetical protein [Aspergillus nidulans FGSC A4]|eukprot:XP_682421.1 hypothetical protein AN9152.2 [Aspergillus nidulans FGSC A4]
MSHSQSHNILLTGVSGYLGGTLLAHLHTQANSSPYKSLYALVRSEQQASAVREYGAKPIILNLNDPLSISKTLIEKEISVVFFLIDAFNVHVQKTMIEALGHVRQRTGRDVHFLHTTGAKAFSSHVGIDSVLAPEGKLLDTDPRLYEIQQTTTAPEEYGWFTQIARTNTVIIDTAEAHGVKSYIFVPCIVYGEGKGFGNKISIQDVAIVKAARAAGRVYKVDDGKPVWPVSHIYDTTTLYCQILQQILSGHEIGHGKEGFYLAASGCVAWDDIYSAFAVALHKRGLIQDATIEMANEEAVEKMAKGLDPGNGNVRIQLGGECNFTAVHGEKIGWKAVYPPEYILEIADEEVDLILKTLDS